MKDLKFNKILVIQTAFIGDAILTLPLIQTLKERFPLSSIDVVVVPRTSEIFSNHPAISTIHTYDKNGKEKGISAFWNLRNKLYRNAYDLVMVPHRSLRSALLAWFLKSRMSIGFNRSTGRIMFTNVVRYEPLDHEIDRNLALLSPLQLDAYKDILPKVFPSKEDIQIVNSLLERIELSINHRIVTIAPGTIWFTKRWPADRFSALCELLSEECDSILLIGGKEDSNLCEEIIGSTRKKRILSFAGKLTLLQSAELIRRSKVLISNDSAPMHLAVAIGTPVIAIFGATVPEFGFSPRGPRNIVVERNGLSCRPCAIHGGNKCPIKTFECMLSITHQLIAEKALPFLR
jgi:heptosyltransferase-2